MSYDIQLCDPVTREVLHLDAPHQMTGGTYALNGTDECWLNITYNYAKFYYKPNVFGEKGVRTLYGKPEQKASLFCSRPLRLLEMIQLLTIGMQLRAMRNARYTSSLLWPK